MTVYTLEEVRSALKQVVEGHEDYIYKRPNGVGDANQCFYSDDEGNPSCGVGYAINVLNPDLFNYIHHYEVARGFTHSFSVGGINKVLQYIDSENSFTPEATAYLQKFQWAQDRKETWGKALWEAEDYLQRESFLLESDDLSS